MAANTFAPFSSTPGVNYIQGAQQLQPSPMAGRVPVNTNQLTNSTNMNNQSLGQQALLSQLNNSNSGNNLHSLLASIINNPQLAQQMAGSQPNSYTPEHPANATRMDGSPLYPAGTPNLVGTPAPANPMGLGATPTMSPTATAYQQWLAAQQAAANAALYQSYYSSGGSANGGTGTGGSGAGDGGGDGSGGGDGGGAAP